MTRLLASTAALTLAAAPLAAQGTWDTFHGQLSAQIYATADQNTPENVGDLER